MTSCFRVKNSSKKLSSLETTNVYPPLIKIQRSLVIPGFINECRELTRTLSLDIYSFDDTVSETSTESSLLSKITSKSNIFNNPELKYELKYISDNVCLENKKVLRDDSITLNNHQANKVTSISNDTSNESKLNGEFLYKQKSKRISRKETNKKRVLSLPTNTKINVDTYFLNSDSNSSRDKFNSETSATAHHDTINSDPNDNTTNEPGSFLHNKETNVKFLDNKVASVVDNQNIRDDLQYINNHNYNFNGTTRSISYSNPKNQFRVNKKRSDEFTQPVFDQKNQIYDDTNELYSNSSSNTLLSLKTVAPIECYKTMHSYNKNSSSKIPGGVSDIANEVSHSNEESSGDIGYDTTRHRTSSLRVLAKAVINLMNKRRSRGLHEKREIKSIVNLTNIGEGKNKYSPEPQNVNEVDSDFKHTPMSNSGSNFDFNSGLFLSNTSFSDKHTVGHNDNAICHRVSDKISGSGKIDYFEQNNNNLLEKGIKLESIGNGYDRHVFDGIHSLRLRSFSSESFLSNYSYEQRVAKTYDMQVLTYDQSAIPIPNLPRNRGKLKAVEDLDKCFLVLGPKLSNIFSCCH